MPRFFYLNTMAKKRKKTSAKKQKLINAKISAKAQLRALEKKREILLDADLTRKQRMIELNKLLGREVALKTIYNEADRKLNPQTNVIEKDEKKTILNLKSFWKKKEAKKALLKTLKLKSINGKDLKTDAEEADDEIENLYKTMGNYDRVIVIIDNDTRAATIKTDNKNNLPPFLQK